MGHNYNNNLYIAHFRPLQIIAIKSDELNGAKLK